uniref:beta-N-acetylhexosaminidase n=1 Tax=Glossina austeni TaxID=7395 RepID=A0A1A9UI84_GLOAU
MIHFFLIKRLKVSKIVGYRVASMEPFGQCQLFNDLRQQLVRLTTTSLRSRSSRNVSRVEIKAATVYGARHAFETLASLVTSSKSHGAYSASNTYRRNGAIDLIKYVRVGGVRVIIEIQGPSHVGKGWHWTSKAGLGYVIICTNREACHNPPCGQLNPFNQNVYMLTRAIYEDIAEINAPQETFHMGVDDVLIPCWNKSKEIRKYMTDGRLELSLQAFHNLWSVYHKINLKSWNEVKRRRFPKTEKVKPVIVWSNALTASEAIDHYLPKEQFIVQTRVDANSTLNTMLADKGYKVVEFPAVMPGILVTALEKALYITIGTKSTIIKLKRIRIYWVERRKAAYGHKLALLLNVYDLNQTALLNKLSIVSTILDNGQSQGREDNTKSNIST